MSVGQVDVQIVIQLWQVVFAALAGCISLLGVGYCAATMFVSRKEFSEFKCEMGATQKEIFELLRSVKENVDYLRGKENAVRS